MVHSKKQLYEIFTLFFKMGTFAFGGVYSMLSFFEKELVDKKKWLTHDEFTESVAMGQITPGAPIVNTGIFIGNKLAGFLGGVVTVAGQTLPSFVMILTLASLYIKYKNLSILQSSLKGIGAAVVGLIFSVVFNMGKKSDKGKLSIAMFLGAILMVLLLKQNPIIVIIAAAAIGVLFMRK